MISESSSNSSSNTAATIAVAAATAAAAVATVCLPRRPDQIAEKEPADDAYCQPCKYEDCPPAKRQREHQLRRQSSLALETTTELQRQPSIVDDTFLRGWAAYRAAPTQLFGSAGFSDVGVQRIDLPFRASELERVAQWLDDETQSGMGALRPFHRLGTPERMRAWKHRFDSLDLGEYNALVKATAEAHKVNYATPGGTWSRSAAAAGAMHLESLGWSILLIEPNRFFPCHKHPDLEIIYCARGAVYENRVLSSALINRPREDNATLVDSGFPRFYRVNKHPGGTAFDNPRYSVHQSYTLDEGAVLLVLWAGKHANLSDPDNLMWDPDRCQNPQCPLACPDKTFAALAHNSADSRSVAEV